MANLLRGQVEFEAVGLTLYVCYGTREIAEAQAALGFRRPDPHQPDVAEDVDIMTEAGIQRQRVIVDATMRQARMIAAFEACLMNPDPEAALIFFRVGLRPWERETGTKLSEETIHKLVRAIGLMRMRSLHFTAIQYGAYLKGEEEDGPGKAAGVASASST